MLKKCLFMMLVLTHLFAPAALAQADNLKIAILRFGPTIAMDITEGAILDVLESYGFISAEENRLLEQRENLEGENLTVYWGDAGYDLPTVNLMVEAALDREPDVLVALNTPVAQVAVAGTVDMDDPPTVLFSAVAAPYKAGIASSSCIKPAHVGGAETLVEYKPVFEALRLQDPGLRRVGFLRSSTLASGEDAHDRISVIAEQMNIEVLEAGVVSLSDVPGAAEGLVERGAEALLVSGDSMMSAGIPIVVSIANDNGLPVFHPSMGSISLGVTIGAGFSSYYSRGDNIGVILAGRLNGDIEIASTAIHIDSSNLLGVNLDSADAQDVEISDDLLAQADTVFSDGRLSQASPLVLRAIARRGRIVPLEQRQADDMAWLASLHCTDEMIAEQQAALDAAEK
ncbi:MAG: ABC transporter substrate binding protein [Chloroflexi bacterium]|nr:ABC transporter substrate binding protein [Chloroflexota bacterium]